MNAAFFGLACLAALNPKLLVIDSPSPPKDRPPPKLAVWVQRILHEPRYGLAVLIGAAVGTPGASYLTALHHLIKTKTATAVAVVAVIVFVLINWALVLVPFASPGIQAPGHR